MHVMLDVLLVKLELKIILIQGWNERKENILMQKISIFLGMTKEQESKQLFSYNNRFKLAAATQVISQFDEGETGTKAQRNDLITKPLVLPKILMTS